ncbi:MAG: N-acetylmuramoyl-L-alanine amidase [Clostridia bacterium]|nr:N-acetylmuramoyl-L-alanine amidase [Clostridia bacterium]
MKKLLAMLLALTCLLGWACAEIVEDIGPVESAEVTLAPTAEPTLAPTVEPTPEPTPEPTAVPRMHGLKIGIDPGHQGKANKELEPVAPDSDEMKAKVSTGTAGVSTGIAEYITNLEIALKLRDALEELGCEVYMTRETHDIDISNLERAQMMNELQVDLVLRLHCDGANDKSVNGIGMFVRKTGEKQEESEAAAGVLLDAMVEATGAKKRGVFLRDTYTMNNWSTVPCILVEMGLMSNPEEDEKLNTPEYQALLVEGMVEGICLYFER